jgi:DNA polymerase-4
MEQGTWNNDRESRISTRVPGYGFPIGKLAMTSSPLIIHVDADAFFASVEQLLIPSLRGRPVVVGSGCIASCSYEARRFGLRAGMSLAEARRRCPAAVILKGNYQIYRCFAERIWEVCRRYAVSLETHLDEAYGELAEFPPPQHGGPPALGRRLQAEILEDAGLPVSIGLAANRMLARLASHTVKPRGVAWIEPGQEESFLAPLPIEDLPGVGGKTARKLHDMNIRTVAQLRLLPRRTLSAMFGLRGEVLYERSRGRDARVIRPPWRMPGTISRQTTFHQPQCDPAQIRGMLFYLLERAMRTVRSARLLAGTVELTIRYDDWNRLQAAMDRGLEASKELAAARTLPAATDDDQEVFAEVARLLEQLHRRRVALRHVGIVLSNFQSAGAAGRLLEGAEAVRRRRLYCTIDAIRSRFGHAAVVAGKSIELLGRLERNDYGFVLRTPSLTK